jgi:Holliday junction resolvasome RuvABC endonuclease subunit
MSILGLRCSNTDYTYTVLAGSRAHPEITAIDNIAFPRGYKTQQRLLWFLREIEAILDKFDIEMIVIKEFEGRKRDKSFVTRIEHEAMVYIAAVDHEITAISKKRKCTIAKDLGLKGRARYLSTKLDTSPIPDFDDYPDKTQDAVLAAWSEL